VKHPDFSVKRVTGFRCKPGKTQTLYWDGYAPGLGVRVTAAGTKSWIFESWLHGRCLRLTIGDLRTWTLGKAQKEATRLKTLTDQGIDPRRVKAAQETLAIAARMKEISETVTVRSAWDVYVAHHAKKWGPKHLAQHLAFAQPGGEKRKRGKTLTVPGVLANLMSTRLADINVDALIAWQIKESATRANNARQGFEIFRTFWRWCAGRPEYKSVINTVVIDDKELRREVPKSKTKRFDVLERAHMKPWFAEVRRQSNIIGSAYLQALVLTGARREEMAELRWEDVDFKWNALWIKDKVDEAGRKVPLTPYLAMVLNALPRKNEWVFSSEKSASGRIKDTARMHNRALSAAGLSHVSLHGLRRTFASLAEWVEMPKGVVAQIMGHAPKATAEQHYINRPLELLAVWHNKYEAWILEQADVPVGDQRVNETAASKRPAVDSLVPQNISQRLRLIGNG